MVKFMEKWFGNGEIGKKKTHVAMGDFLIFVNLLRLSNFSDN